MKGNSFRKGLVVGILFLFISAGFTSVIGSSFNREQDVSSLTFYAFSRTGTKKCNVELDRVVAEKISILFENLKDKLTSDPMSVSTQELKVDFIEMLDVNGLIPLGLSRDYVFSLLNPSWLNWINGDSPFIKNNFFSSIVSRLKNNFNSDSFSHTGFSAFCSIAGLGMGLQFTPIMIPRPRFISFWAAYIDAYVTAANLLTGRGFAAVGPQFGLNLGFMGVGLTWAIPGEPAYFAFGGYSLFTMVGAAEVETYPLNRAPVISEEAPFDGEMDVSSTISELSFSIRDPDGDRMDYSVSTDPDIGSDSGYNKGDGRYSVSVSNLDPDTSYHWTVSVSDGEDTTEETFTFNTAVEAPFVSNPNPADGDSWVSADLSELSFRLEDLQGDLMDFTVETVPDIGSGRGNGVTGGVYSVDVDGLDYTTDYSWFVNVTDGKVWTRKVFVFKTQPIMVFDPFVEGWQYRKKFTVDNSLVTGDLSDFPVLVNVVDSDLAVKAQVDGDDILFMDGSGVAGRLVHEIEMFDSNTGTLAAWVCIPSLSSSSDTDFYMYYGNPGCDNQEYVSRVWNGGFEAVWHMSDDGNQIDSTVNGNTLVPQTAPDYLQDGSLGYSCFFDRENCEFLKCGAVRTEYPISGEVYYKPVSSSIGYDHGLLGIADASSPSYLTFISMAPSTNFLRAFSRSGGSSTYAETDVSAKINDWNYIVAKHSATNNRKIWLDLGNEKTDTANRNPSGLDNTAVGTLVYNGGPQKVYHADGYIDEVRISNIVRSDDWYKTTYYCFKYCFDGGFFDLGPEESGP